MAYAFLDQLGQLDEFSEPQAAQTDFVSTDWKTLAEQRYRDLKVEPSEHKVALAGNILYCFDLMHFCAYPDRCIKQIEKLMAGMESLGAEDPMVKAFNAVCRARMAIRDLDVQAGLDQINIALEASPEQLDKILGLKAWNHYIEDEFAEVGIEYSQELGRFALRGVPIMP